MDQCKLTFKRYSWIRQGVSLTFHWEVLMHMLDIAGIISWYGHQLHSIPICVLYGNFQKYWSDLGLFINVASILASCISFDTESQDEKSIFYAFKFSIKFLMCSYTIVNKSATKSDQYLWKLPIESQLLLFPLEWINTQWLMWVSRIRFMNYDACELGFTALALS